MEKLKRFIVRYLTFVALAAGAIFALSMTAAVVLTGVRGKSPRSWWDLSASLALGAVFMAAFGVLSRPVFPRLFRDEDPDRIAPRRWD